jgi:hypothetical protein
MGAGFCSMVFLVGDSHYRTLLSSGCKEACCQSRFGKGYGMDELWLIRGCNECWRLDEQDLIPTALNFFGALQLTRAKASPNLPDFHQEWRRDWPNDATATGSV